MTFSEEDLSPISALQHLVFCERQWGLIHLEQLWAENRLTVEGKGLHEKVHEMETESRCGTRVVRGLMVRSLELGLIGKLDVVEFHRVSTTGDSPDSTADEPAGVMLDGARGLWHPVPVEYKRGRPKIDRCDEVQLCAQALCLEEMLSITINRGAIFYGKPRRRSDVNLDADLRRETLSAIHRLHELTRAGKTPLPVYGPKCKNCSLVDLCLPETIQRGRSVHDYLLRSINDVIAGTKGPVT
ncbi:MAG: CRISPR-associated protein Cas4 [Phycisphaerae bacterium]|nr:CRISPR-associated protein Cas4 [Phycisphaerae bacterium]